MANSPPLSAADLAPPKLARRPPGVIWMTLLVAAAWCAAGVLFAVDPARHALYPTCWFYATTGWECPGCGGLRATHQLLHGHLAAAWAFNPLAVLIAPLVAWLVGAATVSLFRGRELPLRSPRPAVVWTALAVLLLFTIVRNLPWY